MEKQVPELRSGKDFVIAMFQPVETEPRDNPQQNPAAEKSQNDRISRSFAKKAVRRKPMRFSSLVVSIFMGLSDPRRARVR